MLGDDPDPTVTIVRFGFGEVSDAHASRGFVHYAERVKWSNYTRTVGLRKVNRGEEGRGNYERMQTLRKHADAMLMMT